MLTKYLFFLNFLQNWPIRTTRHYENGLTLLIEPLNAIEENARKAKEFKDSYIEEVLYGSYFYTMKHTLTSMIYHYFYQCIMSNEGNLTHG